MTRSRSRLPTLAAVLVVGLAALYLLLVLGGGAPQPEPAGLPDPGPLTGWALPLVQYGAMVLGIGVVGALLVPVLSGSGRSAELSGPSFRAVRSVGTLALVWAGLCLCTLALTYSDQFALPLRHLDVAGLWGFARTVDQGQALLVQAVLVLALAVASRLAFTLRESAWLLVLAVAALLPPVFTGHSAAAGSHDTAVVSLVLHVVAVAMWVGGVVALWWFLGAAPVARGRAAGRFTTLALWCFGVTLVSGIVNALVRLGSPAAFVTSDYGRAALVKIVLLICLGAVATRSRRISLGRVCTGRSGWSDLAVLTGIEVLLLSAAVALGVGLSRTPPPVGAIYTSAAEGLLGGPLPPPPSVHTFLVETTPSGAGMAVVGLGGAAYAVGLLVLRRQGSSWPIGRTASWYAGLLLVGYATIGGLGTYANVMFSAHMAAHMVLSMVAPILLVLGAPVTLALRALPGADVPGGRGPRHWLAGLLRSRPARLFTHPVVAAVFFVTSLYAIYFSGLFDTLMENHLGHAFMELHFLVVGVLFLEVLVGEAPVPRRPTHLARLALLLLVMPFHAFFAIAVMNDATIIGGPYYTLLDRPYATDLHADQYLGGSLTWALGEIPMVIVLVVLVAQWYRTDTRAARRHDRKAAREGDAELEAYNRMLTQIAGHDDRRSDRP